MQQPWSQPPPDNSGMLWNGNKDGGQESWGPGGQNQPGPNSWDTSGHNPYGHGMGMGNQMQGGMPVSQNFRHLALPVLLCFYFLFPAWRSTTESYVGQWRPISKWL